MPLFVSRDKAVQRMRLQLERHGSPRLQMSLLVMMTAASGFLASYAFLHAGVNVMWVRYPLAVVLAYVVFLSLLWVWLRSRGDGDIEVPDVSGFVPSAGGDSGIDLPFSGGGGLSGGGGAGGAFALPTEGISMEVDTGPIGDALGAASEADEFAIPLVVIVLVVALLLSAFFVIYSAPLLFAELLVDGALATGLYRKLRKLERRYWLETAVRRTLLPFIFTLVATAACGWAMAVYAPEAKSIGGVLMHAGKEAAQ